MQYTDRYESPLGTMLMAADDRGLTGLWFEGQQHFARTLRDGHVRRPLSVHSAARRWLDAYFSGDEPGDFFTVSLRGTAYQQEIWRLLQEVPYGQTVTYGQLAQRYEQRCGRRTSARAVGGAVGRNPISIIVPCHRVVGAAGALTGYAGGVDRKVRLLALETA